MGDISDLLPKDQQIEIEGVSLTVKPLRLSHALKLSKVGDIMQNPKNYKTVDIDEAERDLNTLIGELVPDLKDKEPSFSVLIQLLSKLLATIEPSDSKELTDRGVTFDSDPKAGGSG